MTRRGTMYHRKRNRSNAHTVTDEGNEEFYECIKDIVHHPAVLKMKDFHDFPQDRKREVMNNAS